MTTLRILYHMARADFLERARRYSFLVMLGLVVWLAYASASGLLVLAVPPNYVGTANSHWIGVLMTVTVTMFLGWFGFYLVKGSISRDYETGVGQIIATTPLSRPLYVLGKWLSNFLVLGIMVLIIAAAGILMNLLIGESSLDLWGLAAPLVFIALPAMAVVAAAAVLFESIPWLRGGFGNIVYFFLFVLILVPGLESQRYQALLDLSGFRLVGDSIIAAASQAYPESEGGFVFTFRSAITETQPFPYDGITWTGAVLLPRLLFVLIALGLVMAAALIFDRFNPTRINLPRKQRSKPAGTPEASPAAGPAQVQLTPLPPGRGFRFRALYAAEIKMLLKGRRWWWYVIALGLLVAQFVAPLEAAGYLLAVSWLWLILLLSGLGNREALHNTGGIVYAAPRPALHQIPAVWLAAVSVTALMGSGVFLRYLLAGEQLRQLSWAGGILFIPSLALALGTLTFSRKPFEVVYVTWMYLILNGAPPFDFVGVTSTAPWLVYALLGVGLFALALAVRQQQVTGERMPNR